MSEKPEWLRVVEARVEPPRGSQSHSRVATPAEELRVVARHTLRVTPVGPRAMRLEEVRGMERRALRARVTRGAERLGVAARTDLTSGDGLAGVGTIEPRRVEKGTGLREFHVHACRPAGLGQGKILQRRRPLSMAGQAARPGMAVRTRDWGFARVRTVRLHPAAVMTRGPGVLGCSSPCELLDPGIGLQSLDRGQYLGVHVAALAGGAGVTGGAGGL